MPRGRRGAKAHSLEEERSGEDVDSRIQVEGGRIKMKASAQKRWARTVTLWPMLHHPLGAERSKSE